MRGVRPAPQLDQQLVERLSRLVHLVPSKDPDIDAQFVQRLQERLEKVLSIVGVVAAGTRDLGEGFPDEWGVSSGIQERVDAVALAEGHDDLHPRIRTVTHSAKSNNDLVRIHAHHLAFRAGQPTVEEFVDLLSFKLVPFCLRFLSVSVHQVSVTTTPRMAIPARIAKRCSIARLPTYCLELASMITGFLRSGSSFAGARMLRQWNENQPRFSGFRNAL